MVVLGEELRVWYKPFICYCNGRLTSPQEGIFTCSESSTSVCEGLNEAMRFEVRVDAVR